MLDLSREDRAKASAFTVLIGCANSCRNGLGAREV